MKKLIIILTAFNLVACIQQNSIIDKKCINRTGLNDILYNAILEYQKVNSIPILKKNSQDLPPSPEIAFKYIYQVQFKQDKGNVIAIITLKPDGVKFIQNDSIASAYGVYQDSCLKPTYIVSDTNLCNSFISIFKNEKLEQYKYDNSSSIDFIYVQYVYIVYENKLIFQKKIMGNIGV